MIKRAAWIALAGFLAACSRSDAPGQAQGDKPSMSGFQSKEFRCDAPAGWRVLESQGGAQRASFFGPPAGPAPFSSSIAVYFYGPGSNFGSPRDYWLAKAGTGPEGLLRESQGRQEFTKTTLLPPLHGKAAGPLREEFVLVPSSGGFYALVLSAPEKSAESSRPAFRALVDSFKPGS